MKHILSLITVFTLLFTACEGDPGPQGPPGLNGQDGGIFVAQSFETTPLDFTTGNAFEQVISYPVDFLVGDDMVLVYLLWNENPDPVWRLLPQTIYTDNGSFQYNYQDEFTQLRLFMDAESSFDFNTLSDNDTLNQIFRVVALPSDLINSNDIDINNFNDVVQYLQ